MCLPTSVMVYPLICSDEPSAGTRCRTGTTMPNTATIARNTALPRSPVSKLSKSPRCMAGLTFRRAAFLREQAPRPPLDEQDQRDQHENLGEHGAGPGFEHLVDDAQ